MALEYVELHCHSYFSLLDGASSPEALVEQAAALGYSALALTDHDGLYSAVRFWRAAQERGIKAILGAEVTLDDGCHLTLLAENQRGYANLCRVISTGQLAGQKGQPHLTLEALAAHAEGLLCLSGCCRGAVAGALLDEDDERARQAAGQLRDVFADRLWIELQRHGSPTDARLTVGLIQLARRLGVKIVVTNNVHYAERSGQRLHDVLTCIRQHTTLPEALASGLLHPNSERYLKSPQEMAALFADPLAGQALRETVAIAERCQVSLDFSGQRLPAFDVPEGHSADSYLRALCEAGLVRKFDPVTPQAQAQLEHELAVIGRVGLVGYFLVVWDVVRFARERGIRCQGRGSAANSLVAYTLDITPVDPLRHNLLFERFLSEDSHTTPDIDVDFAADRREEVIQYVYERYGEDHVGMVCNVVTYRARSAVRDVAKALAFPPDAWPERSRRVIDRAAKALDTRSTEAAAEMIAAAIPEADLPWGTLVELLREMEGVPRHLSIHVGGMLITAAPLVEVVPLERATLLRQAQDKLLGRVVVQWDKDSVEEAGLIKIDLLSLRTLGMVEEARRLVDKHWGVHLDLDRLPLDDPAVYEMLRQGNTVGCFQVESRAQIQMLPKMSPRRFEDLIIEVALLRPGPIQGNMVHPYLRRRQALRLGSGQGLEPVSYAHPSLEPILAETLGVMVFQEQVNQVAMAIAGLRPGKAEQLRRAISRSRSEGELKELGVRFVADAHVNGVDEATAAEVFRQLSAFSGYGFCKSHAAAFALVAYQTLYLKAHYPAAFFCAILNHQPMGFYGPGVLVGDARRHGVPVLPPDVNRSQATCRLEIGDSGFGDSVLALRLGLRYVHELGEMGQECIVQRRREQPFQGLRDFCRRTRLPRSVVENLIRAGALDSLGRARRKLLWELGGLDYAEEGLDIEVPIEAADLPKLSAAERMGWEYELLGLSPGDHVMRLYREWLDKHGVLSSQALGERRDGETVRVAGRVVVRQRPPSAKGFVFLTIEDEAGLVNLVVRPGVYRRYRETMRNAALLLVEGQLQREGQAFSVMVKTAVGLRWPGA